MRAFITGWAKFLSIVIVAVAGLAWEPERRDDRCGTALRWTRLGGSDASSLR